MNSKRIGVSFLLTILIEFFYVFGISIFFAVTESGKLGIVENLILAQMLNVVPLFLVVLIGRRKDRSEKIFSDVLGFRRIKISTALMTVLYTILISPLSTLANAISMIFVDNAVNEIAGDVLDVPFVVMFLIMAVFGPFCEELVFRGAFFRGFRKSGNIFGAIVMSAVLFAIMHMNFNQAAYAVLLGIMMALAAEATGSTVTSFIIHLIFNGQSVCLLYLSDKLAPDILMEEMEMSYSSSEMALIIAFYLLLAVVCTSIAFCVLTWMASNEGKQNFLRTVWASRKNRGEKMWSVCLIIAVSLALIYMIAMEILKAVL